MRLPYWDWATHVVPPKEVTQLDMVEIITHNGATTKVINPLKSYVFHPIDPSFASIGQEPRFSEWKTTLRYPNSSSGLDWKSDVSAMEK